MINEAVAGKRVTHKVLGNGTIHPFNKDQFSNVDYTLLKVCAVVFDRLTNGYSNPFTVEWESLTEI